MQIERSGQCVLQIPKPFSSFLSNTQFMLHRPLLLALLLLFPAGTGAAAALAL